MIFTLDHVILIGSQIKQQERESTDFGAIASQKTGKL